MKLKYELWMDWLTDTRLARWNHLRYRAGLEDITREQGGRILAELSRRSVRDLEALRALDAIKERIAE